MVDEISMLEKHKQFQEKLDIPLDHLTTKCEAFMNTIECKYK